MKRVATKIIYKLEDIHPIGLVETAINRGLDYSAPEGTLSPSIARLDAYDAENPLRSAWAYLDHVVHGDKKFLGTLPDKVKSAIAQNITDGKLAELDTGGLMSLLSDTEAETSVAESVKYSEIVVPINMIKYLLKSGEQPIYSSQRPVGLVSKLWALSFFNKTKCTPKIEKGTGHDCNHDDNHSGHHKHHKKEHGKEAITTINDVIFGEMYDVISFQQHYIDKVGFDFEIKHVLDPTERSIQDLMIAEESLLLGDVMPLQKLVATRKTFRFLQTDRKEYAAGLASTAEEVLFKL
jgi:hypothetical protein